MKKSVTVQPQKKRDENCHCEPERQRGRSNLFLDCFVDKYANSNLLAMTGSSRTKLLQKSGITLVEMIVAMLLSTIIVSALACQFVAMVRFNTALQNTIEAERDAYTIVNNMTRILRFADPASITFDESPTAIGNLSATIKAGHLSFVTADTTVYYKRDSTRPMVYRLRISWDGINYTTLSEYVSFWDLDSKTWDPAAQELSISFDITKTSENGQTVTIPIRTKIKVRGDL